MAMPNLHQLLKARFASVRQDLEETLSRFTDGEFGWKPRDGMRTVGGQILEIADKDRETVSCMTLASWLFIGGCLATTRILGGGEENGLFASLVLADSSAKTKLANKQGVARPRLPGLKPFAIGLSPVGASRAYHRDGSRMCI